MRAVRTIPEVRDEVARWKSKGRTVALVPTMGALHDGHLSLVDQAKALCDRAVVSLFVNPTQFGPGEDFETYPRQHERDVSLVAARGCDLVFHPTVADMYPDGGGATAITVGGLSEGLCGAHRPGHFAGVATVVMKLLMIAQPHVAVFGEKDYQQLQIIRKMVRDLDVPVAIVGGPIVRESDGLAMSSRNAYLDPALRATAPLLFRTLTDAADEIRKGAAVMETLARARQRLIDGGFGSVDYVSLVDTESLQPLYTVDRPARLVSAARLGTTRLIDNVPV